MTTNPRRALRTLGLGVAAALALSACVGLPGGVPTAPGGGGAAGGGAAGEVTAEDALPGLSDENREYLVEPATTTWDVRLREGTDVLSGDGLKSLKSVDRGTGEYVFDRAGAEAAGVTLREGAVLLIAGDSLVRITDVADSGGDAIVATEPASLDEVIQDGTIGWDAPLSFDFDQLFTSATPEQVNSRSSGKAPLDSAPRLVQVGMLTSDGEVLPVASADGEDVAKAIYDSIDVDREAGKVDWTFSSNGNKYQFRLISHGDSVEMLIVVSRRHGDRATMAYRAEGTIGSVRSVASAEYAGGELKDSDVKLDNLAADLTLSATAAGAGSAGIGTEIPVPFLKFVFMVGPLPVTLEMKAEIIGTVTAGVQSSASAESKFTYRGGAGFSYKGSKVSAAGQTLHSSLDPEPADSAAPMGIDVDAQFGVAFPVVSVSLLGQGLIPYIRPGFVIGSSLHWGGPAAGFPASSLCKETYVRGEVVAGYDFEVLGMNLASGEKTLWEKRRDAHGDSCPDKD